MHAEPTQPDPVQPEPDSAGRAPARPDPLPRHLLAMSGIAVVVGLLAGAGASAFLWVEHKLQNLLWHDLPDWLGQSAAAPWLVVLILILGALIVHAAMRLPGKGGHSPLAGFGMDIGGREIGSVLIAALASLSAGAVIGPEAPLIAVGTALAAMALRRPGRPLQQVMMFVGAMAAVSAIFGNPLVTAVLLLEFALVGGPALASPAVLLSALSGMAASYVLQVGLAGWSGLGQAELGLPGLPSYTSLVPRDALVSIPLAVIVSAVVMAARLAAMEVETIARRRPLPTILAAAVVVAACAIGVDMITDGGLDLVLFSGESAMPQYLAVTSLGTAVVILIGKAVAYIVSLGSGFRGGPIFPAVALGALLATITTLIVPGTSVSALAATSIAAATAGMLGMPFVSLLLGVMLTYPSGGATTILAVVGTVIGMITRLAAQRRIPALNPSAKGTDAAPQAAGQ